ncbi:pentapeptide repeat-containing protein [Kitasatospora sp. NPDC049258]|uniref:pentapeptide repeat-containing protein n=1 Tax=Kitasatospora sp. NPDC049258 TaxID=3155394 RepID=UPI00342DBE2A
MPSVPAAPDELDQLPYAHLLQPHTGPLRPDRRYDTVLFDGLEQTGPAAGAGFLECAFTGAQFDGAKLRRSSFNEAWMHSSRLVATDFADSDWQDSALLGTVLAGVAWYGAALRRVVFRQCKLEAVNLRGATLRDVVFEDCLLRDVDFGEARMTDVAFPGSTLEEVRLGGAALTRTDLRGAVRLGLADGHLGLRGALISTHQLFELAPQFAQALGIVVKDD